MVTCFWHKFLALCFQINAEEQIWAVRKNKVPRRRDATLPLAMYGYTSNRSVGVMQNPRSGIRFLCTAMLINSTSVWNWSSPPGVRSSFNLFTATSEPSDSLPLYTFPKPPLPRTFLLLKLSVATWSSLSENLLSCPRWTSGSSSAESKGEHINEMNSTDDNNCTVVYNTASATMRIQ